MRVTTDLWVSAIVRRAFAAGGFAAIVRRGATEAGAVMVIARDRLGEARLFLPASQTSYDEARPNERMFTETIRSSDETALQERMEREIRFDPDLWIVELEVDDSLFQELVAVTKP